MFTHRAVSTPPALGGSQKAFFNTLLEGNAPVKTGIPVVPLAVWKNLYSAAATFHSLRPWEMLDDLDLIGVRDSSTGETGYGAAMGSGGTLFGFCCYRGAEGFDFYRRLIDGEVGPEEDEAFAGQNCLKVEFGPRSDLWPEDHAVIRQLGLSFRGKHSWPEFRSLLPRYAPWLLNEAEARFFTLALQVACYHCERIEKGEVEESLTESECLVYQSAPDSAAKYNATWEPLPAPPSLSAATPILNLARLNAIREAKPKPDSPWEADLFYLPSTIHDRGRPYYMRMVVVCQQSSGFVLLGNVSGPEDLTSQVLADAICSSIETHGFLPEAIVVKRRAEADSLKALSKALDVPMLVEKNLGAVQRLKDDMMNRLLRGG